ncbi:MAG: MATE family efflux transporter [Lentisphaeria bacterium]|nr:MATE family efflux transporter [Lentisphaeria bacterium]
MSRPALSQEHRPGGVAELLAIALPMVVSSACETLMMFVDRLFLSRLGPEYMSAAMGGGMTCFMFMTFFIGLTGYASPLVAQHLGAGQKKRCPVAVGQSFFIALLAYPLVLACIPAGHWLFRVSGTPALQLPHQTAYFDILVFGSILGLIRNCFSSFFSGIGRTRIIMLSAMASMIANVGANYLLIFGHCGFPRLGMAGAAYGTIFGSCVGMLILVAAYFQRQYREEFDILAGFRLDPAMMRKLFRLGSPSGLEFFLNMVAFNLLVLSFHSYGVAQAAAVTIAFNWDMVSFIPLIGVNIGVSSLVGRYMGAGNPDTAHRATMSGLRLALAYTVVMLVVFSTFARPLVTIFQGPDTAGFAETVPLAVFMVRLVALYVCADALGLVFSGALRGAGDTFWTMCLSVGTHWTMSLLTMWLIRRGHVSPRIAWLALVGFVWVIGGLFYARYRSGRWRLLKVVDEAAPLPVMAAD